MFQSLRSEHRPEIDSEQKSKKSLWDYACNGFSEIRSEMRPKTLELDFTKHYACSGFRAIGTVTRPRWDQPILLCNPLSIWLVLIYLSIDPLPRRPNHDLTYSSLPASIPPRDPRKHIPSKQLTIKTAKTTYSKNLKRKPAIETYNKNRQ